MRICFALLLLFCHFPSAWACTALSYRGASGNRFLAKNFDWPTGDLTVRLSEVASARQAESRHWASQFRSIGLHLGDMAFPVGGVNSAGLAIEVLLCPDMAGGQSMVQGARNGIPLQQLEWVQYQLDRSANLNELEQSLQRVSVRIDRQYPVHFFACDREGCAVVEVSRSGARVLRREALPVEALSNMRYERSVTRMAEGPAQRALGPQGRFNTAARNATALPVSDPLAHGQSALRELSSDTTQWNIIYDLEERNVMIRTRGREDFQRFSFDDAPERRGAPPRVLSRSTATPTCSALYSAITRPEI